jgi:hypothetical protein
MRTFILAAIAAFSARIGKMKKKSDQEMSWA